MAEKRKDWSTEQGGETRRLYFDNAYQVEFEARVVERTEVREKPAVVLDSTCFYPESGGQPCDGGELNGVRVLKVMEEGERILHVLEKEIDGEKVRGKIDWNRRFDHMQQHSGQHILSQAFVELLKAETLSFHLGEDNSTIEIDRDRITEEELDRVEERANTIIFENRPIRTYFVSGEELPALPLRKPPAKSGLIRIVEVEGFDYSACGGTHCRQTSEIGLIKIVGREKIRQHVRLSFLCGWRALRDYRRKNRELERAAAAFSSSFDRVAASAEKLLAEMKALRKQYRKIREELTHFEADRIISECPGMVISRIWSDRTAEEARNLALEVIHGGNFLVLFGVRGEAQDHLILARSEGIRLDLREWLPFVLDYLQGKGGGRESLVEVVCPKGASLEAVIEALREKWGQAS